MTCLSSSSWKYSHMILLLFVHSITTANYDRYDFNCPFNRDTKAINAAFVKSNNLLIWLNQESTFETHCFLALHLLSPLRPLLWENNIKSKLSKHRQQFAENWATSIGWKSKTHRRLTFPEQLVSCQYQVAVRRFLGENQRSSFWKLPLSTVYV